ncbi:AI-2E family transporter [bacterium]|nr:AI-2E family transporter [bacterium]
MSKNIWLQKKPQSVLDWLGIIFCSIGFYILLGHLNLFVGAVGKVLNILAPFATGIVIAYVLDCIVRPVHHKLLKDNPKMRWLAILIAYVAAVLIIFVLGWMVIPQVISSIVILFENLPSYFNNVQSLLLTIQENYGLDVSKAVTALDDYEQLMNELGNLLAGAVPKIVASVGSIASNVVDIFTAIASSVYMLAEKDKLLRQLRILARAILPRPVVQVVLDTFTLANENFEGFFIGKIIDSGIIGVLTFVCCSLLNISFAPLIAVVVGITNIIPVFGPFIGAVPCIIILLFVKPIDAVKFLVLILIIQQVDGNIIGPKILGKSIGVSALWVLFAIVLGGDLWGVVGMVLGVPVFATLYALLREFVQWCLDRRGIDADGNPAQTSPQQPAEPDPAETALTH